MAISTWIDGLQQRLASRRSKPRNYLYSEEQFQRAALCERMRVDRNGSVLSILAIDLPPDHRSEKDVERLAKLLAGRLRMTDTPGHLSRTKIGVLLPDTDQSGAWKVAADICDHYEVGRGRPSCEVFVYPTHRGDDVDVLDREGAPSRPSPLGSGPALRGEIFFVKNISLAKRCFDIFGASLGLILACPVILVAALAIKLTSPGPVFYRQEREGLGGRRFTMYKLRTMRAYADRKQSELRCFSVQDGPAFKMSDDPRITLVGRVLRQTSLDELPQLWNVLKGEMSLVGPRPLPTDESLQCTPWQRQRLQVTPGLTCTWQIWGRNVVPFDEWMRMDLQYVRQQSLAYDMRLVLLTGPAVFLSKGPR